jgi:rRNA-processing protein FCF1
MLHVHTLGFVWRNAGQAPSCVQIDLIKGMMDCLYAECTPCITACVMAELEKLGQKYRVALKIAKDPRIKRLPCSHSGTYADDCICERVTQHRCYIVATCDKDLRRRLRKVCPTLWSPGMWGLYVAPLARAHVPAT